MENDINKKIKKQFGREAEKYVHSPVHANKDDLNFILEFINPQNSWIALDIATGGGHLALTLSKVVSKVYATDMTDQMLQQVENQLHEKKISNIQTQLEDVHALTFSTETFDLVGSRIAPHHFHTIEKALEEMSRVTKRGGYVFIQDTLAPEDPEASLFFNKIEKLRDPSHVRDLSESEWITLLEKIGLKVLKTDKKEKIWPLKWWTERMSTPAHIVKEIIELLELNKDKFSSSITLLRQSEDELIIKPLNGYFLAQKV